MKTGNKGFTLIEILIAIVIVAIVFSSAYGAYRATLNIISSHQKEDEAYAMARTALDRIIQDLGAAAPYKGDFELSTQQQEIDGKEFTTLVLRSTAHVPLRDEAGGGVARIEYYVERDEDGEGYLLLRDDRREGERRQDNQKEGYLLCRDVQSIRFRFQDAVGQIRDGWDSLSDQPEQRNRLPQIVEVELDLADVRHPELPLRFATKVFLPVTSIDHE
ncbi:MAG: type II secretion system protein GspJ [Smithellaceae bacterium]|nr:type II secretion system protein GspJ [Smithellaceae bacterium]